MAVSPVVRSDTKAVILVGGEATRLRPLTCNTPKAMVPVLNVPFLEYVIRHLGKYHIKDIALTLSRLPESPKNYFGDGSQFGSKINYTLEDSPLGTAGAVKNAEKYLRETFLVLNGDIFTDLDIGALINFHMERKAKATISLTPVEDPTIYGVIETDRRGRVTRFLEKPSWSEVTTNMINAGTYVLQPEVLSYIPAGTKFSFERELFPLLLTRGEPVYAYPSSAYWMDIGTPEKYHRLNRDLLSAKSKQYIFGSNNDVIIGKQSRVHSTAEINGPAIVGDDCVIGRGVRIAGPAVIGPGCTIQPGAVIEDSIIWGGVQVERGASVIGSVIANNCRLCRDCCIAGDSVLGDSVTVLGGCRLERGSMIWPDTIFGGGT